jgi:4-amino-4-deoxy-L-arabinose transferase-like glycosyltransferase
MDAAAGPGLRILRFWGLLLALGLIYYVWPLTLDIPLLDPDEGLHAAIAREMVERGDWVTPRFLGEPFFDKPILFFWVQAVSLSVLGLGEAAIRAPGLMLGLAGAVTTGLLGGTLFSQRIGWVAGLIYTTMLLPAALSQAAVHDVALVPCTNLAFLFLWRSVSARRGGSIANGLAAGLALGLAGLAKGLIGIALVGLAFGVYLMWNRRLLPRGVTALLVSLVTAIIVAAPWFVEMSRLHPGYAHYYFLERHFKGFATTTQLHSGRDWWYYVPILLAGALPWTPALAWFRAGSPHATSRTFVWIWLLSGLVFLSAAGAKLLTYVLPLVPALAILAALPWAARMDDGPPERARSRLTVLTAATAALMMPACLAAVTLRLDRPQPALAWVGGLSLSAAWLLLIWPRARGARREFGVGLMLIALTFVFVMRALLPPTAAERSARELARYYNREGQLPAHLRFLEERVGSFVFYLGPALREGLTPDRVGSVRLHELRGLAARDEMVVAIPDGEHERLAAWLEGVPAVRVGHHWLYRANDLRW